MAKFTIQNNLFLIMVLLFAFTAISQENRTYTIKVLMDTNKARGFKGEHGIERTSARLHDKIALNVTTDKMLNFNAYQSCQDTNSNHYIPLSNYQILLYLTIIENSNLVNEIIHEGLDKIYFKDHWRRKFCMKHALTDSREYYSRQAGVANHLINGYHFFNHKKILVDVSLTISLDVDLTEISRIVIPGVRELKGIDFIKDDLVVEVYRENDTPLFVGKYQFSETKNHIPLDLIVGDSVVFKSDHKDFKFDNVPEVWLARSSGESKYYCTKSINPGEIRPFIGFDSQVHGVAMRKYPPKFKIKHDEITKPNTNNFKYTWSWIAQRRMDSNKTDFDPWEGNVSLEKVKHASNFGMEGFNVGHDENGNMVTKAFQRNNQREGYNMQFLHNFKSRDPSYRDYGESNHYILGLDTDETVYINSQYKQVNETHKPSALLVAELEEWKIVPDHEFDDPIVEIVDAYRKSKSKPGDFEQFDAYEILDQYTYSIDPNLPKRSFNHKDYVKYSSVLRTDDNNKAKGQIKFMANGKELTVPVNITLPQPSTDYGFDAITGENWPAETQENVQYGFVVPTRDEYGRYIMEYTHENELGMLHAETKYYTPIKGRFDGDVIMWTQSFNIKGWGYNEITVYFQRHPKAQRVIIAGKELLDVNLRFMSVAGSDNKDFEKPVGDKTPPFGGVDLKEGRGEGKSWYLRDFNGDTDSAEKYGGRNYNYRKEYTIQQGNQLYFTVMDSDPHTFIHYKDEFYLSERFMAKRLLDEDINERVKWYYVKEEDFKNLVAKKFKDYEDYMVEVGTGRTYATDENLKPGKYVFVASYNKAIEYYGSALVFCKVTVLPFDYVLAEEHKPKGIINIYELSPKERSLLKNDINFPHNLEEYRIAKVEDIFSKYTHIDGPRAEKRNNKQNRFGLENDFNNHFLWKQRSYGSSNESILEAKVPSLADKRLEWFPHYWIRHYEGELYTDDMDINITNQVLKKDVFNINQILLNHYPKSLPEKWQWRLPWISPTNWSGYKTRTNIKAIYDMKAFFNNIDGAFRGKGNTNYTNNEDYKKAVESSLPSLTDKKKIYYDFYTDLVNGRKLIIHPPSLSKDKLIVYNVVDDDKENNIKYIQGLKNDDKINNYYGADLSSVQNLKDKGIAWNVDGQNIDPYEIVTKYGMNTVRLKLLVNPKYKLPGNAKDGLPYIYNSSSELTPTIDAINKAKHKGLKVILDLHLSDTWADPKQNIIPEEWKKDNGKIPNSSELATKSSQYLSKVLKNLKNSNALPDVIQIGNETNSNIMLSRPYENMSLSEIAIEIGVLPDQMRGDKFTINWNRMSIILNSMIDAIEIFNDENKTAIKSMFHIAGVSSAKKWINNALDADRKDGIGRRQVKKPDFLGVSYYPGEEEQYESIQDVMDIIEEIYHKHTLSTIIVETGYPQSYEYSDTTNNIQGGPNKNLPDTTSPEKQYNWLLTLLSGIQQNVGGAGVIYWEPFWIGSNDETTPMFDTVGSTWEHMSFFGFTTGAPNIVEELKHDGGIKAFKDLNLSKGIMPRIAVDSNLDFGQVPFGFPTPTKQITINNVSEADITLSNLTIPSNFTVSNGFANGDVITPANSLSMSVAMITNTLGTKAGNITFNTNDPNTPTTTIALTGKVIENNQLTWLELDNNLEDSVNPDAVHQAIGTSTFSDAIKAQQSHAVRIDAPNNYVSLATDPNNRLLAEQIQQRTIAFWFRADSLDDSAVLYDEGANNKGIILRLDGRNNWNGDQRNIRYSVKSGGNQQDMWSTVRCLEDETWYHLTAVYDNGNMALYYNGHKVGEKTSSLTVSSIDGGREGIGFGSNLGYSIFGHSDNSAFKGYLDDLQIYDVALTEAQIQQIVESGTHVSNTSNPCDAQQRSDTSSITAGKKDTDTKQKGYTFDMQPNPASESITITMRTEKPMEISFEFVTMDGKLLTKEKRTVDQTGEPVNFDVSKIEEGFYIVRAKGKDISHSENLVIKH